MKQQSLPQRGLTLCHKSPDDVVPPSTDPRGGAGLEKKSLDHQASVGDFSVHHLDRDVPLGPAVDRFVDHAHSAGAEDSNDSIFVRNDVANSFW